LCTLYLSSSPFAAILVTIIVQVAIILIAVTLFAIVVAVVIAVAGAQSLRLQQNLTYMS
jgi:hypothetical protein